MVAWISLPRFVAVCCVSLAVCFPVAAAPLDIMVEDAAEPFSKADGTGYANDVVRAAFAAVGVEVKLNVVPYSRCKALVLEGATSACFNMAWDPAFEGKVKFADEPLYRALGVYFQNKAQPLKVHSESELAAPLKVGIVKDYEYADTAMQTLKRGVAFIPSRTEQISLRRLAAGQLDAALVISNDLQGSQYWAESAGVARQVNVAFPSTHTLVFIGFSLRHPQGMWALEQFNQGYKLIRNNGTVQQLRAKWSSPAK
ncbi:transporter substrate-binding domain-containing protein [Chitinibacter sp. SCUT-21]|uniref:substrate-binding periplasmic protein n=1 Tax=Chitinibacter sp. SCUT-21 TaxID=2970891 RepID=UPI0035A5A8F9